MTGKTETKQITTQVDGHQLRLIFAIFKLQTSGLAVAVILHWILTAEICIFEKISSNSQWHIVSSKLGNEYWSIGLWRFQLLRSLNKVWKIKVLLYFINKRSMNINIDFSDFYRKTLMSGIFSLSTFSTTLLTWFLRIETIFSLTGSMMYGLTIGSKLLNSPRSISTSIEMDPRPGSKSMLPKKEKRNLKQFYKS